MLGELNMDSNYNYEEELMIKIAWYYYIENLTQQEIAKILGINRIKILRLLDKAKENGLITFQIRNSNAKDFIWKILLRNSSI